MQQANLTTANPAITEGTPLTPALPTLALTLITLGALTPLTMMIYDSLAHDIVYYWWTWPAIPAAWLPAAAGALLMRRHEASGSLLLLLGASAGLALFWHEYAALTFGPIWLLAAYAYLDTGRRHGWLTR
jgi:hypothetical protein